MRLSPRFAPLTIALLLALAGTACSEQARQDTHKAIDQAQAEVDSAVAEGGTVSQAFAEARDKLQKGNLPLSAGEGVPKAELTPQGDLLINDVAVPMNDEQRAAALAFRTETIAVAEAGMAMGEKGAAMAGDALALAAKGIFGGDTSANEAAMEARGKAMEAEALALCERVNGLDAAQKRLAAILPAFEPYSKAIDINADCNSDETRKDADAAADQAAASTGETTEV